MARSTRDYRQITVEIDCPCCREPLRLTGRDGAKLTCGVCDLPLVMSGGQVSYEERARKDPPLKSTATTEPPTYDSAHGTDASAGHAHQVRCPHCGAPDGIVVNKDRLGVAVETALISAGLSVAAAAAGASLAFMSPLSLVVAASSGAAVSQQAVHASIKLWRNRKKAKQAAGPWTRCKRCNKGVTVSQLLEFAANRIEKVASNAAGQLGQAVDLDDVLDL